MSINFPPHLIAASRKVDASAQRFAATLALYDAALTEDDKETAEGLRHQLHALLDHQLDNKATFFTLVRRDLS